jgi:hypothetical protein
VPVDVTTLSTQGQPVSVMAVKKDRWTDRGVRCMTEIFSCTSAIFRAHSSACSVISSLHRTRSSRFVLPPVFLDSHTTTPFHSICSPSSPITAFLCVYLPICTCPLSPGTAKECEFPEITSVVSLSFHLSCSVHFKHENRVRFSSFC